MNTKTSNNPSLRAFLWVALATGLVLSIPLLAMQFTHEVDWGAADFILMGVLLAGAGCLLVLASRYVSRNYRFAVAALVAAAVVFIWAELAVGVFTNLGS